MIRVLFPTGRAEDTPNGRSDRQETNSNGRTFGLVREEVIHLLDCPIVCADDEPLVVHVEDEVLALESAIPSNHNRHSANDRHGRGRSGDAIDSLPSLPDQ